MKYQLTKKIALQISAGIILSAGMIFLMICSVPVMARSADVAMIPQNFSALAEMVSPAVVNIRTEKNVQGGIRGFKNFGQNPFGNDERFNDFFEKFFGEQPQREFKERSLGSGFIIDREGYIVTNNHVVENADKIKVKLKNGKQFDAEIIGKDPSTDIALIKISAGVNLPTLS